MLRRTHSSSDKVHFRNPDFPRLEDGRTLHLGAKEGDLANRILTVGDHKRALRLAHQLDNFFFNEQVSMRGFRIYTGTFKGVPISIVAIGMGFSMADFFIREARHVIKGPMAVLRLGTCGAIPESVAAGSIMVASKGSLLIQNSWAEADKSFPYTISPVFPADQKLAKSLVTNLVAQLGDDEHGVVEGLNCSADSFYSSQGRDDPFFNDANDTLIQKLKDCHPEAVSLEMETGHMLALANRCTEPLLACGAAIAIVNRTTGAVISHKELLLKEVKAGTALLETLASFEM